MIDTSAAHRGDQGQNEEHRDQEILNQAKSVNTIRLAGFDCSKHEQVIDTRGFFEFFRLFGWTDVSRDFSCGANET